MEVTDMKKLWFMINKRGWSRSVKNGFFITLMTFGASMAGGLIWLLFGRNFWTDISGLFCFTGYAGMYVGFVGAILYLYNHDFA